jgi:small subunit ribosomal protein S21
MIQSQKNKLQGNSVVVKEHENINQALRRFKKKVDESGLLDTLRKKEFYEKPTTKRKREAGAAKARYRKKLQKEANPVSANRKRMY